MKTKPWDQAGKVCLLMLVLVAGVAAIMLLPTSSTQEQPRRRFIPRYQFEKEIRGPTYHVVRRVFENDGYRSKVKARTPPGQPVVHEKYQLRNRRAVPGDGSLLGLLIDSLRSR